MKSRASVTVMVTWVCVKDSSNIQSGWREGKVNLRETESSKVMSHQRSVFETPAFESFRKSACWLPEEMKQGGQNQLVVDGNAHVARLVEG